MKREWIEYTMPVPGGWLFFDTESNTVTLVPDPGHADPEWRELHADYFAAQTADTSEDT